jgi:two-component system, NarL family, sensor histidine kinase UhpB
MRVEEAVTRYITKASASLRARLILIPPIFLLLGIIIAVGATLIDAPNRVALETASGLTIGGHLIDYALEDIKLSANPDAALERLKKELSHVRHIRVKYMPLAGSAISKPLTVLAAKRAPDWLVNWFAPTRIIETFPIAIEGEPRGELVMSAEPADEVGEVWGELIFLIGLLSAISVGIVTLIWLLTSVALRPLRELAEGLDRLERGHFDGLREIRVAELRRVGEQFNRLAKSLARTEADNRLLIDRLFSIQESERKELARELHDEFGASLFGIRAAASCIIEAAATHGSEQKRFTEITERASAISSLADAIQKHNHRILERIQPIVLNQMGVCDALRHLVDSWCAAHRGFNCELEMPNGQLIFDEDVSLAIYRIVQECLTNVARHSRATKVHITMKADENRDALIRISDDGIGLSRDCPVGFGFLGMSERVRKLGGRLNVSNGREMGTLIEVFIPRVNRTASVARDVSRLILSTSQKEERTRAEVK